MRNVWNWIIAALGFGLRPVPARSYKVATVEQITERASAPQTDNGARTSLRYDQVERRRKLRKKRNKGLL